MMCAGHIVKRERRKRERRKRETNNSEPNAYAFDIADISYKDIQVVKYLIAIKNLIYKYLRSRRSESDGVGAILLS